MSGLTGVRRKTVGAVTIAGAVLALGIGAAPAAAADVAVLTHPGWDFQPSDYPQCTFGGVARTIRYMADRIVDSSPVDFADDDDPADEDGQLYQQPTAAEHTDFRAGLTALIDDDPVTATDRLDDAGFAVCSGEVDSIVPDPNVGMNLVLVYSPAGLSEASSEGAPMLVLSGVTGMPDFSVLSGPHLTSEIRVFDQILAAVDRKLYVRGAVLAGTDRCNRLALAPAQFQGNTSECGGDYRISDMAHNVDTIYQDMHDVLRVRYPQHYSIQLHGMSAAGISVSRGTSLTGSDGSGTHPDDPVTVAHSYAEVRLKKELNSGGLTATEKTHHDALSSCTSYVHSVSGLPAVTRNLHCGTFNAQLSRERDTGAADRFLHIEQSQYIRINHGVDYLTWVTYGLFANT